MPERPPPVSQIKCQRADMVRVSRQSHSRTGLPSTFPLTSAHYGENSGMQCWRLSMHPLRRQESPLPMLFPKSVSKKHKSRTLSIGSFSSRLGANIELRRGVYEQQTRAGINHKQNGVTSERVNEFTDVELRQTLGIDPTFLYVLVLPGFHPGAPL